MRPPVYGLVLAGGASVRMGRDKASLPYRGVPQLQRAFEALSAVVEKCFISIRADQKDDPLRGRFPSLVDPASGDGTALRGPAAGMLAAHAAHKDAAWFVLACDLPFSDRALFLPLIEARETAQEGDIDAVAYRSAYDGLPEPLCAIWEPAALERLAQAAVQGRNCPRKTLAGGRTRLLSLAEPGALDNINTQQERHEAMKRLEEIR